MSFQVRALDAETFAPLFALSDADLRAQGGVRMICDKPVGFPCRVSLQDAAPGDEVVLVNFQHQPAASPFQSSHAIFVRRGAPTARLAADELPALFRSRILSLRAFDAEGMMLDADLVDGREAEGMIEQMLADPRVAYLHAHYAKPGCFAARIDRA